MRRLVGLSLGIAVLAAAPIAASSAAPDVALGGTEGGPGNDMLVGTTEPDIMHGRGGNDNLFGKGSADIIRGGTGNDIVRPGAGADYTYLGKGRDAAYLHIDNQFDHLSCGPGADTVWYYGAFNYREKVFAFEHGCPWHWSQVPGS